MKISAFFTGVLKIDGFGNDGCLGVKDTARLQRYEFRGYFATRLWLNQQSLLKTWRRKEAPKEPKYSVYSFYKPATPMESGVIALEELPVYRKISPI